MVYVCAITTSYVLATVPRKYFASISSFNPHYIQLSDHLSLHLTEEHKQTQTVHTVLNGQGRI